MKYQPSPEELEQEPQDFVYDETNRHLPKKYGIIKNAITREEAEHLKAFIESKLPNSTEDDSSQVLVLPYRTDEWDELGVIHKVQELSRQYVRDNFYLRGAVEPRKFELIKTEPIQSYKETYSPNYITKNEILYTAVVTPVDPLDYDWGQTVYIDNGEGFRPSPTDIIIHRNEQYNNWTIEETINGTRLDLVLTLREVNLETSYDYPMEQSVVTDEEY
jgi:hypothetical protein